jgi:LasA protease
MPSSAKLLRLALALVLASSLASCAVSGGYWLPPRPEPTQTAVPFPTLAPPTPAPQAGLTPAPGVVAVLPSDPLAGDQPTPTSTPPEVNTTPILYYSQAADTLPVVAVRFGVKPEEIKSTEPLPATALLPPGQLLIIPRRLVNTSSSQHLLPDSELVYSPSATDFDVASFVKQAGGYLSTYTEWLKSTGTTTGADIVLRVALENSINPRLLLALLEYQGGWVYGRPSNLAQSDYPLGLVDLSQKGLFQQLVWAVNQLSVGYYGYREGRLTELYFRDGIQTRLAPDLNAGTVALQYFFAQLYDGTRWLQALDMKQGFPALYERMFGSPWLRAQNVEPLYPPGLTQPPMILPFMKDQTWSFTGGPHGAWEHDGAYAALDFAPPSSQTGCVRSTVYVAASAAGLVVRSGNGVVVLDLDGDGREQTGWVLLYLHVSSDSRVPVGTWVDAGDPLGYPSCEGGIATGTHLHIARKYNGEWIAAGGPMPFDLSGWVAHTGSAAYFGTLTRDGETVTACTCSSFVTRITRTEDTP